MNKTRVFVLIFIILMISTKSVEAEFIPTVSYDDRQKELVVSPQNLDLFVNFKDLMPGGTYLQSIDIENTSDSLVHVFFKVENLEDKYFEIGKLMDIVVVVDNEIVLEGNLFEQGEFAHLTKLFSLEPQSRKRMDVNLSLSDAMDNQYAQSYTELDWFFYIEKDEAILSANRPPRKPLFPLTKLPSTGIASSYFEYVLIVIVGITLILVGKKDKKISNERKRDTEK